jgi:hypothetical protein
MKHLEVCLEHLNNEGITVASDTAFLSAWRSDSMRNLRNALEHEEEYVAGLVQNQGLVGTRWQPGQGDKRFDWDNAGIREVTVLGVTYDVRISIHAALQTEESLFRLWDPPEDS